MARPKTADGSTKSNSNHVLILSEADWAETKKQYDEFIERQDNGTGHIDATSYSNWHQPHHVRQIFGGQRNESGGGSEDVLCEGRKKSRCPSDKHRFLSYGYEHAERTKSTLTIQSIQGRSSSGIELHVD